MQLDEYQEAAARAIAAAAEPLIVVEAGAGSGKTRTLVEGVVRAMADGVPPAEIAVVTFTRKAADEMTERIAHHPRSPFTSARQVRDALRIGTAHSIALSLRRAADGAQHWSTHPVNGRCLDTSRSLPGLYRLFGAALGNWTIPKLGRCGLGVMDEVKAAALETRDYVAEFGLYQANYPRRVEGEGLPFFEEAVELVEEAIKLHRGFTFEDVLHHCIEDEQLRGAFKRVIVDEAQDNNEVLDALVKHWADGGCLVKIGDPRQSIFGFRGSRPERFQADMAAGALYRLPLNYRSGHRIVEVANELQDRFDPCQSARDASGLVSTLLSRAPNRALYARAVAEEVRNWVALEGARPKDAAVLCRTNEDCVGFLLELLDVGVPARMAVGSVFSTLWGRLYLDACGLYEADDLEALRRLRNKPYTRYIPDRWVDRLSHALTAAPDLVRAIEMTPGGRGRSKELARFVRDLRSGSWAEAAYKAARFLAQFDTRRADEKARKRARLRAERLQSFYETAIRFQDFPSFLAFVGRLEREQNRDDAVSVGTIHSAKGLEWNFVALDESKLPHPKATNRDEEERLRYVGVTRARDALIRADYKPPSQEEP